MDRQLEQYLDRAYVYKFTHGPDIVRTRESARQKGISCISLAHLALRDLFDYEIPADLQCLELYADREHFYEVDDIQDMQRGDLLWFGLAEPKIAIDDFEPRYVDDQLLNWSDYPIKHVAVYTGEEAEDYLLLHSTPLEGTNVIWPMSKFADYKRYEKFYGITRLKVASNFAVAQY